MKIDWLKIDGLTDYQQSMDLMMEKHSQILQGKSSDTVIMLEHPDIYTTGVSYQENEILNPGSIPVIHTRRGGKVTYHGPGQRVVYPIINLQKIQDIRWYVNTLEQSIINSLERISIKAFTVPNLIGIWVNLPSGPMAKIASIGVKVKKWVTYHGLAININTDNSKFLNIIPCGISNYSITSLQELGADITLSEFDQIFQEEFTKLFLRSCSVTTS